MTPAHTETPSCVVDVDELLARCLGNLEFAERILAIFQDRCSTDLDDLEQAIEAEDLKRVAGITHRLKGACANAAAHSLCERISHLREAACSGDSSDVSGHYRELRNDWDEFVAALPELRWRKDAERPT
ncbi:MAG: Hpt domain-containing protein [Pirellulales bacterium]